MVGRQGLTLFTLAPYGCYTTKVKYRSITMTLKQKLKSIDKQTVDIICENHGMFAILKSLLIYIQESNKELVSIKKEVNKLVGYDVHPLNQKQLKKLREGGDTIAELFKLIELNDEIKQRAIDNAK